MSGYERRIEAGERDDDRTPLLGRNGLCGSDDRFCRRRGDLPLWRHILEHKMTWAWYNVVISTGAVSLLLFNLPYGIHSIWVLGSVIYIIALILFLITLITHLVRFIVRPSLLPGSMVHPVEGQHISSLPAALGILIINGATYAEKLHGYNSHAIRSFFWIYIVLSFIFGISSPLVQFCKGPQNRRTTREFTSTEITGTLPLLLAGPTAAVVLAHLKPTQHRTALGIMAFGVILQGMGILLSLLFQSSLLNRLHRDGFPPAKQRPALFLASIPPALTSWSCTALAQQALRHFPVKATAPGGNPGFVVGGVALSYVGVALGLVFWGLAVWWFVVAAAGNIGNMSEIMVLGSGVIEGFMVVFAHAALFLCSNELLSAFEWPKALTVVNEVLGVATVVVWGGLVCACVLGMVTGRLLGDD
ncbi:voltage-dependent anion channel [Trichophaea hybrida]|nr:voltage-dependent anion channel [Trichophaea hybrida]